MSILDGIDSPADLRLLPPERLPEVALALRNEVIELVSKTGGHLAAGLGAVELATVLHYVFDTPRDRLIWDVGHQGYPHKILTGRREGFMTIGQKNGIGKFLRRHESEYDVFGAGHAGTSISAATGIAEAILRLKGEPQRVLAVIGDGALTAGMAYEGLNNAGYMQLKNLVVVLNDNEMSISPNVGAHVELPGAALVGTADPTDEARHPTGVHWSRIAGGDEVLQLIRKAEQSLQGLHLARAALRGLGFNYIGPIDGHNIEVLLETFEQRARHRGRVPGADPRALRHPEGSRLRAVAGRPGQVPRRVQVRGLVGHHAPKSSGGPPSWTKVFSDALIRLAHEKTSASSASPPRWRAAPGSRASRRSSRTASTMWASPSSTP